MRIGEVAQQVNVSASTIRYYERAGLLPHAGRDRRGYRDYSEVDVERIGLVAGARQLGISLADIRQIVALHDHGRTPSPRIVDLLQQKALEVDERSSQLETIKEELCRLREAALELEEFGAAEGSSKKVAAIQMPSTTAA